MDEAQKALIFYSSVPCPESLFLLGPSPLVLAGKIIISANFASYTVRNATIRQGQADSLICETMTQHDISQLQSSLLVLSFNH